MSSSAVISLSLSLSLSLSIFISLSLSLSLSLFLSSPPFTLSLPLSLSLGLKADLFTQWPRQLKKSEGPLIFFCWWAVTNHSRHTYMALVYTHPYTNKDFLNEFAIISRGSKH